MSSVSQDKNTSFGGFDESLLKHPFSPAFVDFLEFERKIFEDESPIAYYDPSLIRYGEYRFLTDNLPFNPADTIVDLGCESNIFTLYLAYLGAKVIGVDINPAVNEGLTYRINRINQLTNKNINYTFMAADATDLDLAPASVDKVVAVSSIEHMYSKRGHGDQLAAETIAKILKPGGLALLTLPYNYGDNFIESPDGDSYYPLPYREYNQQGLKERLLSNPQLETVSVKYLDFTTPDPRFGVRDLEVFWITKLTNEERLRWGWFHPAVSFFFHPIVSQEYRDAHPEGRYSTALITLRKK